MSKEIDISMDKSFIMAKAFVSCDKKEDNIPVRVRQGYNLYLIKGDGQLELQEGYEVIGSTVEVSRKDKEKVKIINKNNNLTITLYWIKQRHQIRVPFGFKYGNDGINGVITLSMNDMADIEAFLRNFPVLNWETEYKDNVTYQYLSEYFIDSERKQNGISIAIRNMLMPRLKDCCPTELKEINETELKNNMEVAVREYFEFSSEKSSNGQASAKYKYGLKIDSLTISVIKKGG